MKKTSKLLPNPQELQLQARLGWLTGLGSVFQSVALSQRQEFVLKRVANAARQGLPTTSIGLAVVLEVSTPNACAVLGVLVSKGYLKREDVGAPSGGSLFEYALVDELNGARAAKCDASSASWDAALRVNPEMTKFAAENGLSHWACVSAHSGYWWRRVDGVEWEGSNLLDTVLGLRNADEKSLLSSKGGE